LLAVVVRRDGAELVHAGRASPVRLLEHAGLVAALLHELDLHGTGPRRRNLHRHGARFATEAPRRLDRVVDEEGPDTEDLRPARRTGTDVVDDESDLEVAEVLRPVLLEERVRDGHDGWNLQRVRSSASVASGRWCWENPRTGTGGGSWRSSMHSCT